VSSAEQDSRPAISNITTDASALSEVERELLTASACVARATKELQAAELAILRSLIASGIDTSVYESIPDRSLPAGTLFSNEK